MISDISITRKGLKTHLVGIIKFRPEQYLHDNQTPLGAGVTRSSIFHYKPNKTIKPKQLSTKSLLFFPVGPLCGCVERWFLFNQIVVVFEEISPMISEFPPDGFFFVCAFLVILYREFILFWLKSSSNIFRCYPSFHRNGNETFYRQF